MHNISSQIIEIEGLTNLISEFAGNRHSLVLEIHGSTAFKITEFKVASGHGSISIEEFPDFVVIFGELFSVNSSVIFAVIVQDVDSFFSKEGSDLGISVDHVSQVSFLEVRVHSSVPNSDIQNEPREGGQNLESEGNG